MYRTYCVKILNIILYFSALYIQDLQTKLGEMSSGIVTQVVMKNGGKYRPDDVQLHLDYFNQKLFEKIENKTLYPIRLIPACLTHYWDLDGPTYCPKCPMSLSVISIANVLLLRLIRDALYELHFDEENIMRYSNFFRMLPLIHIS